MADSKCTPDFIHSLRRPVVFRGLINDWVMLSWTLDDWSSLFGDNLLPYRCGYMECRNSPLWEQQCKTKHMTLKDFVTMQQNEDSETWCYFDYKYIKDCLKDTMTNYANCLKSFTWRSFGFPDVSGLDSTIWIGSVGAHTPCHMDTYGCNLVAQIYGSKQWILFPPEAMNSIRASRVPYEESSIYSLLNFNCPLNDEIYSSLNNIHFIELQAGDVLFVPPHWWHYVENLNLAISINTWLPVPSDDSSRANESLVRFFVSQLNQNLTESQRNIFLNPNELDLSSQSFSSILNLVELCMKNSVKPSCSIDKSHTEPKTKKVKMSSIMPETFLAEAMEDVPKISCEKLKAILTAKCKCASIRNHLDKMKSETDDFTEHGDQTPNRFFLQKLVNAFCHPDVIDKVKYYLMKDL